MTIHLASDHAGYTHKEVVKEYLTLQGHTVVDHGAVTHDPLDDYPDVVTPCAQAVVEQEGGLGVVFGGSGQGEAMCANRVTGIRAAVYYGGSVEILTLSKEHNNANILSIGARFVTEEESIKAVTVWLETSFSGEPRHIRRLSKF